jgi:hypothetical protein
MPLQRILRRAARMSVVTPGGRTNTWLNTSTMITIHFTRSDDRELDRLALERLVTSANSRGGLFVTDPAGSPAHPTAADFGG